MRELDDFAELFHQSFQTMTEARDRALKQTRMLTRYAAHAIRSVHRQEWPRAEHHLAEARKLAETLRTDLADHPSLYFAGYTQDALKEFAEASIVYALVKGEALPDPQALGMEHATYLRGLAESVGELRRRCLDLLREGYSQEVELLLSYMDDIYEVLVTMDYPDAITMGLRRLTDIARGINERTRGDVTVSLREQKLEQSLRDLEARLKR